MAVFRSIWSWSILILLLLGGCSSAPETTIQEALAPPRRVVSERERATAMQLFIDGSLKESKGEFAEAILDYQEALRYDHDPAIFYALAKSYAQLRRFAPAAENAAMAVQFEPKSAEYRSLLAQILINAGQFDKAAAEYRMILMLEPGNVTAAFTLAQLLERVKPQEALDLYYGLIARQGPTWEVLLQVAQLNTMLQRHDKAADAFAQMLALDPSNLNLKQNLAEAYIRLKQYAKAETLLTDVLEQNPSNVMLRSTLTDVYLQQNDWSSAKKQMTTILAADSLDPDTHLRIGMAYYAQTLKDTLIIPEAIAVFKQYEKEYPSDARPYVFLGVLHRGIRKDSIAENYFTRATQAANWNGDAWWQLGWMYFDKQDFMETVAIMNKAKQYVTDDFRIYMLLGIAYNRAGLQQDSRVALERAAELNPKDVTVLSSLGITYDALRLHAESDSAYERALRIDPAFALVLNNYAYSLSERGLQLDRAESMSKASLAADSLNSSYLDTYGWILYKKGKYAEALPYIKRAVEMGDVSSVVLEHLGDVYAKVGQKDEALRYWKQALEKDASNVSLRTKVDRGSL